VAAGAMSGHEADARVEAEDNEARVEALPGEGQEAAIAQAPELRRRLRRTRGAAFQEEEDDAAVVAPQAATTAGSPGEGVEQVPPCPSSAAPSCGDTAAAPAAVAETEGGGLRECTICMDAAVETVFVPCGHMAACRACGEKLGKKPCPVCRKKIKIVQRFYMS